MTLLAILLITCSAFTHAGWNILCKARTTSVAFFWYLNAISLAVFAPSFLVYRHVFVCMPARFWWIIVISGLCQTVYYVTLARAYRLCDVSVAYPMVRSMPVILVPVVTVLFGFGAVPGIPAFLGMFLIFCGCLILPQKKTADILKLKTFTSPAMTNVISCAVFIAGYSIADREALRILNESALISHKFAVSFFYSGLESIPLVLGLTTCVFLSREERKEMVRIRKELPWTPVLAALMCSGGYLFVLSAMQMVSNVSYIVAFRQLSIPIGAALGVLLLHESCSRTKITGLILIVTGLVLTALF